MRVVEDLDRHAADRVEGLDIGPQQRLQVLVEDVAGEQEARMAEHQAEQPDDPAGARIIGEVHHLARHRARSINRRLDAPLDIFAHGLRVTPRPPRDRGDGQPLSMQLQVPVGSAFLSSSTRKKSLFQMGC